jgi:tyrosyl-tRNA synthetase
MTDLFFRTDVSGFKADGVISIYKAHHEFMTVDYNSVVGLALPQVCRELGIAQSAGEVRRAITQQRVRVNGGPWPDPNHEIQPHHLVDGRIMFLKMGPVVRILSLENIPSTCANDPEGSGSQE